MTTTTFADPLTSEAAIEPVPAASLLGTPAGELVLRMTAGPHVGRVVRLSAAKCSIGSSADCTLRLRGRGIEPLHCLILRGSKQTVIRRWSCDTRLNDRPFEDAPLVGGDRLSVGPVEFQVLAVPEAPREASDRPVRRPEVELAEALGRIERLTERLETANRQGRRRLRTVIARLRKYQLRLNDLEGRRSQLVHEREQLQAERARLTEQTADLQGRYHELKRQTEDAADKTIAHYEQAAQSLQVREAELTARAKSLDERLAALEAGDRKLADREAELTHRGEELHRLAAECERREAAVVAATADLKSREDRLAAEALALKMREEKWGANSAELKSREERLTADAAEWQAGVAELRARRERYDADVADLQHRETVLAEATDELQRTEYDVAARCQALKNHWAELTERESRLERDREALARRERELAEAPPPAIQIAPTEEEPVNERLDEARRQLEQEREALNLSRAECDQARVECERQRTELDKQQAELLRRRETLELAARVLDRRAVIVESDETALAERTAELPATSSPEPTAAAEQALADRLQIEHLEAQVITWRDEAKHWKHQFDELHLRDELKVAAQTVAADEPEPIAAEAEAVAESEVAVEPEQHQADAVPSGDVVAETPAAPESVDETIDEPSAEAPPEPAAPHQSESAADVLRRLGMAPDLEGEAAPAPPPPPRPAPPPAAEHHEQDESLDEYMQQLFQRLGVKQGAAPAPAAPSNPVTATRALAAEARAEAKPEPSAAPPAPIVPLTAEEFKARSVAAESKCDLSALRALANVSAKTAIAKHQVKTQSSKSKWKFLTAVGSLGVAGVSAWAYLFQGREWGQYGVVAGLATAALSMLQSFRFKYGASKSARSLDDVLQKSMSRAAAKEAAE